MGKGNAQDKNFRVILLKLAVPRALFEKKMAALGVDPERLEGFLDRMPVVVRRGLDKSSAIKYGELFAKAGAKVKVDREKKPEEKKAGVERERKPEEKTVEIEREEKVLELPPFDPDITYKPDRTAIWLILAGLAALALLVVYILYPKSYRLRIDMSPGYKAYYAYSSETVSRFFKRRTRNPDATVTITASMNLYQEVKDIKQGVLDIDVTLENVDLDIEVKTSSLLDHTIVDRRLRETEKGLEKRVLNYRIDRRGRLVSPSSGGIGIDPKDRMIMLIERALLGIVLPEKSVKMGEWWTHRITNDRFYFMELKGIERLKDRRCALIDVATRKSPLAEPKAQPQAERVSSEVRVNGRVYLDLNTGQVVLMDSEMTSVQKKASGGKGDPGFVVLTEGTVRLEME